MNDLPPNVTVQIKGKTKTAITLTTKLMVSFGILVATGGFWSVILTNVTETAKIPPSASQQSLEQITMDALRLNENLRGETSANTSTLRQLRYAVSERGKKLVAVIANDPGLVLKVSLPDDIRERFPKELQSQLEQKVELEGELQVLHVDDFDNRKSFESYQLKTKDNQLFNIAFADKKPQLLTGSRVQLKGVKIANNVAIQSAEGSSFKVLYSQPTGHTVKKVAVILMNFQNDQSQPFTPEQARGAVFTNSPSTNTFFKEASFGQLQLEGKIRQDGDVFGWYTIPYDNTDCTNNWFNWTLAARAAAQTAGIDLTGYDNFI
jgi:hypothetical protein